jgi:hypothetical protein
MALELNLTKNTNEKIEGTLGKYYARVEYKGTLSKADLAEHMHEHNAIYSQGLVEGILTDAAKCIRELALQGFVVKIDNLGLFKASVEANGLTLEKGAKIAAGRGSQRTDEELQENIAAQQFAVGDVKLIMQATGNTTIEKMNADAKLSFTSKTKAEVKRLTGSDATEESNGGSLTPNPSPNGEGSDNQGGGSNSGSQNQTLASPTISGNTSFTESTQVSISGPDGAEIHYTTDGTVPTAASALYSEAFTLSATTTVKAIAIKDGQSSEVASRVFTKSSNDDGMGQD